MYYNYIYIYIYTSIAFIGDNAFSFFTYGFIYSASVRINTLVKTRDEYFQHGWHPEIFVVPKREKKCSIIGRTLRS